MFRPVDGAWQTATLPAASRQVCECGTGAALSAEEDHGSKDEAPNQSVSQGPRALLAALRPMQPGDEAECLRIWRETWPEAFSEQSLPADEEFFRQTEGEEIFVVPSETGLAGFVTLWLEEPFVHFLLVDSRFRRQRVGEALLKLSISRLPAPVHLKCNPANVRALAFYARMGCTEVERVDTPGNAYVRLRLPEG